MFFYADSVRDDVVRAMCDLIAHFIQRQQLVVLAMLELRPDISRWVVHSIPGLDASSYDETFLEKEEHPQTGIWKSEWKYRLHGIGCELVHIHTDEPLEWDALDSQGFRFEWFWQHLEWRLKHQTEDPNIKKYAEWLSKVVDENAVVRYLFHRSIVVEEKNGICLLKTEHIDQSLMKITWIEPGALAASAIPLGKKDLESLYQQGIRAIVTLTEHPLTIQKEITERVLEEMGLICLHAPIRDQFPPTIETVQEVMRFIDRMNTQGNPVLMHCHAGSGRTGTMLHAYYLTKGLTLEEAQTKVKAKKPSSQFFMLSDLQKRFLETFGQ